MKRNVFRIIASVIMCIVLALLPLTQALAAQGDIIIARTEDGPLSNGMESSCGAGDALYFLLYGNRHGDGRILGVHHVGDAEMQQYEIQLGEALGENCYESIRLLSDGENVYALRQVKFYDGDNEGVVSAELYRISINGTDAAAEFVCNVDWSVFQSGESYSYVERMICAGDYIVMSYYDYDNGGMMRCVRMNLADGSMEECSIDGEFIGIAPYADGRLLLQQYADDSYRRIRFSSYDPATDESEILCEADAPQYSSFEGIACDFESGAVYYTREGEIFELNLQTGESSEAITDMPGTIYSDGACAVLRGGYYASAAYDCYIIRNLHPEERPSERLKIFDGSYEDAVSRAFYDFANGHGDVSAVLSRDYSSGNALVEDMMNRSSDIDVYIINTDSSDYQAVFDRGYMMELTDSEKLAETAERLYPALREELSIDGALCAIPASCYFWLPFVNRETLEKLDMSIDEIPTNWSDLLDFFMEELPNRLPEDGSVALMDGYIGDVYARQCVFDRIFASYQQLLKEDPDAFSSDEMAQLLQKLEQVDFQALGQPAEEETQQDDFFPDEIQYCLFEMNMGTSIEGISQYYYPMVMSLTPDTPRMLTLSATAAFVNPFTKNRELALEFMEALTEKLSTGVQYTIYSDRTEPVENSHYQENMQEMQQLLDQLQAQYDSAQEADRQALQEALDAAQESLEDYENYRYSIREEDIAWIHQYADALALQGNNWLYSADSGDAYQLVQQYSEGQIDARKLMNEIGRKIRMMMMEGY